MQTANELQENHQDLWNRLLIFISDLLNQQDGMARIKEYGFQSEFPLMCLGEFYFSIQEQRQFAKFPTAHCCTLEELVNSKMDETEDQKNKSICVKRELAPILVKALNLPNRFYEDQDFCLQKRQKLQIMQRNYTNNVKKRRIQKQHEKQNQLQQHVSNSSSKSPNPIVSDSPSNNREIYDSDPLYQQLKKNFKESGSKMDSKSYHALKKREKKLLSD